MAPSIRNELVSKNRAGTQLYHQLEMSPVYAFIYYANRKKHIEISEKNVTITIIIKIKVINIILRMVM